MNLRTVLRFKAWRTPVAVSTCLLVALLAVGCGGGSSSSSDAGATEPETAEVTDLSVELDWLPGPNHPVLYWAQHEGFFEKEGLAVTINSPSDPAAPLKLVATGKVDLGLSYEPEVMQSAEQGLDVKVVGSIFPVPLASFIAGGDSGITEVADVKGKSVGYSGIPVFGAYTETALESAQLSKSDVDVVNVGFTEVPALLAGKVSALTDAYRNDQAIQIWEEEGVKPTVIPVDELGVPTYDELVFIANTGRLESDPDYRKAVERFLAAYYQAFESAKQHPAEAAEVLAAEADRKPEEMQKAVPLSLKLMQPAHGNPGCLSESEWKAFGAWMVEHELLSQPPDLASIFANELLPMACGS
jgi:putative hydroxymethylpyrimidine transport system substrate-binding protein